MRSVGAVEVPHQALDAEVAGVDELDFVKAVGSLIYDLDGKGNLRITDAEGLQVLARLDVTPAAPTSDEGPDFIGPGQPQVGELLVADEKVVIFGTEVEVSDPVPGDPSATQASTGASMPFASIAWRLG